MLLKPEEIKQCSGLLKQFEPGFLPLEIFNQIARLVCLPTVDVIPVKFEQSDLYIGLVKRESTDLWWPNMWHLPGTILRSTDSIAQAIKRITDNEIKVASHSTPIFHNFLNHQTVRGAEVVLVHSIANCQLGSDSQLTWFPVNDLPKNFIESELEVVEILKKIYIKLNNQNNLKLSVQ